MDNSFLELFKMLGGIGGNQMPNPFSQNNSNNQNQNYSTYSNRANGYYPNDFNSSSEPQNHNQTNNFEYTQQEPDNNLLPLLMSMLGKGGNPFASILGQGNNNNEKKEQPENVSQNDDIIIL